MHMHAYICSMCMYMYVCICVHACICCCCLFVKLLEWERLLIDYNDRLAENSLCILKLQSYILYFCTYLKNLNIILNIFTFTKIEDWLQPLGEFSLFFSLSHILDLG